jgi:hypothetical protein
MRSSRMSGQEVLEVALDLACVPAMGSAMKSEQAQQLDDL